MARAIGLGGFFFKARDPKALAQWYAQHLGIEIAPGFGGAMFQEDAQRPGCILWCPFKDDTQHFAPSTKPFMINFRVDDLDALLAQLRSAGVEVDAKVEKSEYGAFGWIMDPEGNRVELWQPPADK
jgi:predicted enzyme related to lactoylglutathione lyase